MSPSAASVAAPLFETSEPIGDVCEPLFQARKFVETVNPRLSARLNKTPLGVFQKKRSFLLDNRLKKSLRLCILLTTAQCRIARCDSRPCVGYY